MFADDFKNLRASLKLSQQALSDKYGIPLRTIQSWEEGFRLPPVWLQKMILEYIKIREQV